MPLSNYMKSKRAFFFTQPNSGLYSLWETHGKTCTSSGFRRELDVLSLFSTFSLFNSSCAGFAVSTVSLFTTNLDDLDTPSSRRQADDASIFSAS